MSLTDTYLTTAINYTNGPPHIGHAYEAVIGDVICRSKKILESEVFFMTGTDEHGKKIASSAEKNGFTPQEWCDKYSGMFKELNKKLGVEYDRFIRTTDDDHTRVVYYIFETLLNKEAVYLGKYSGWYCVREESFITEEEAVKNDYCDPLTGVEYDWVEEPSYLFKMEPYREKIIEIIENGFISSHNSTEEILSRLKKEKLKDLSISRVGIEWGIPLKDGHVAYVWFDALINYMTGCSGIKTNFDDTKIVHLVGKDIVWFHAVVWPCILLALEAKLPYNILVHGFINDKDGKKMSKSVGNVVSIDDVFKVLSEDEFRYYMCRTGSNDFDHDIKFSFSESKELCTTELANLYGNSVKRVGTLAVKFLDCLEGFIEESVEMACQWVDIWQCWENEDIFLALDKIVGYLREFNEKIVLEKPWVTGNREVIRNAVSFIYNISLMLYPYIPKSAEKVIKVFYHDFDGVIRSTAPRNKINFDELSKLILFRKMISNFIIVKQ